MNEKTIGLAILLTVTVIMQALALITKNHTKTIVKNEQNHKNSN